MKQKYKKLIKQKYKKFMSNNRKNIKKDLSRLTELNHYFLLSNKDMKEYYAIYSRLQSYYKYFNMVFHKDLSIKQFATMFID